MAEFADSRCLKLLAGLDRKGLDRFRDFLDSPYHNRMEGNRIAMTWLAGHHPAFRGKGCTREAFHEALYPGDPYTDSRVRSALSRLLKALRQFLAVEAFVHHPWLPGKILLDDLMDRNQADEGERQLRVMTGVLDQLRGSNSIWPRCAWELENARANLAQLRGKSQLERYVDVLVSDDRLRALNRLTAIAHLEYTMVVKSVPRNYNVQADTSMSDLLLETLLPLVDTDEPSLGAFYRAWRMLRDEDEVSFQDLRRYLNEHAGEMPVRDLNHAYIMLENFCSWKSRAGENRYRRLRFEVCRDQEKQGLGMMQAWGMEPMFYLNLVLMAFEFGELDYGEGFAERARPLLDRSVRQDLHRTARAMIHIGRGEYGEALEKLTYVQPATTTMIYEIRMYQAMCYYGRKESLALDSLIDASRHLLANHPEMPPDRADNYRRFFNFVGGLDRIRREGDRAALPRWRKRLDEAGTVSFRFWLEDRGDDLGSAWK